MDLLRGMTQSLRAVADLLLPRTCIVCEKSLHPDQEHLCSGCLADLPLTRFHLLRHNPMADRFNDIIQKYLEEQWAATIRTASTAKKSGTMKSNEEATARICATLENNSDSVDNFQSFQHERYAFSLALFLYNSESDYRHITHRIKYHADLKAGDYFGRMLGREIMAAEWLQDVDTIVPVPLHWTREWSRGYNQAEVIARAVAKELDVPLRTDILKRTRRTKTQTKVGIAGKGTNVRDAFRVQPAGTSQRHSPKHSIKRHDAHKDAITHILLIDDVFTTGSTLGECFKALRKVYPPSVRISVATLGFVGGA